MVLVNEERGPEIDPHIYIVSWFLTKEQTQFSGKRTGFFQQIVLEQLDIHSKKKKRTLTLDPHSITCTKSNSKCTIDINAKPKTTKILEENIGEKSFWHWVRQKCLRYDTQSTIYKRNE